MAQRIFSALPLSSISITMTGGEPFLLPHFFELARHLETFPNLESLDVITNGTKAGSQTVASLVALERLRWLKVSLESSDPAVNDAIRGAGNLERVSRNIDVFLANDLAVVLMMTLSEANASTVEHTIQWSRQRGLSGIIFERCVPLGRGRNMAKEVLSWKTWHQVVKTIGRNVGLSSEDCKMLAPYRAYWLELSSSGDDRLRGALCNLGESSMALMPGGSVFPCRRLPIPIVSNLLDEPFETVLRRLRKWSIGALRSQLDNGQCAACGRDDCVGCRALVFALTGDPLGDDEQCFLNYCELFGVRRDE